MPIAEVEPPVAAVATRRCAVAVAVGHGGLRREFERTFEHFARRAGARLRLSSREQERGLSRSTPSTSTTTSERRRPDHHERAAPAVGIGPGPARARRPPGRQPAFRPTAWSRRPNATDQATTRPPARSRWHRPSRTRARRRCARRPSATRRPARLAPIVDSAKITVAIASD